MKKNFNTLYHNKVLSLLAILALAIVIPAISKAVNPATNAKITIENNLTPSASIDNFLFSLKHGSTTVDSYLMAGSDTYVFTSVPLGTTSISVNFPAGWATTSQIVCDLGVSDPNNLIIVDNSDINCKLESKKLATLTVINDAVPAIGNYLFTLSYINKDDEEIINYDPVMLNTNEQHTFKDVTPGTYNLLEILSASQDSENALCTIDGSTEFDPRSQSIVLEPGSEARCYFTHGSSAKSTVFGSVFYDVNANGLKNSEDENLSNWKVDLFKVSTSSVIIESATGASSTPTDPVVLEEIGLVSSQQSTTGGFYFPQLDSGEYIVCENPPAGELGWIESVPPFGHTCDFNYGYRFVLGANKISNLDFGNYKNSSIEGIVFEDLNRNKIKDPGEGFIAGANVHIGDSVSVSSDAGFYSFINLLPDRYVVTLPTTTPFYITRPPNQLQEVITKSGHASTVNFGVYFDNVAPSVPVIDAPLNLGYKMSSTTNIHFGTSTDNISPVINYILETATDINPDGSFVSTTSSVHLGSANSWNGLALSQGTHYIHVQACDESNNCSAYSESARVVVDNTAPISTISSPNPDSQQLDGKIHIAGNTTDLNSVASVELAWADYNSGSSTCGAYSPIDTLLNASSSASFDWSLDWEPTTNGLYCLTAHGLDKAGNKELSPVVKNISFKKKIVAAAPQTPASTNNGGGGGGGNGPIVTNSKIGDVSKSSSTGTFALSNATTPDFQSNLTNLPESQGIGRPVDFTAVKTSTSNSAPKARKILAQAPTVNVDAQTNSHVEISPAPQMEAPAAPQPESPKDLSNTAAIGNTGFLGLASIWWYSFIILILIIAGFYWFTRKNN